MTESTSCDVSEFYPNWKQVGSMEFWKSGRPRTYNKAKVQCEKEGSELVDQRMLQDPKFVSILELTKIDGAFWIKSENGRPALISIMISHLFMLVLVFLNSS